MSFDGSLKFDTKVDTSGFDEGSSSLKNAMEKLTSTIERLSDSIVKSFNGAARAVDDVCSNAVNAASQVDDIAKSAKNAQAETEALKEKMDTLSVDTGAKDINIPEETEATYQRRDFRDYGNEVQQFVDDYVANMGKASESTNEFKREIESLTGQLKQKVLAIKY